MQDLYLAQIEEAFRTLAAATTVQEIKKHIDAGKLAEVYAKQAKLGKDLELKAFQYVKEAERKLGEMLASAKEAGQIDKGGRPTGKPVPNKNRFSFTLQEAGISRKLSSRAQKLASVPKEEFDKAIAEGKEPVINEISKVQNEEPQESYKSEHEDKAYALKQSGMSLSKISKTMGIPQDTLRRVIERGRIRHEEREKNLTLPQKEKVERASLLAAEEEKRKLAAQFDMAVNVKVREILLNSVGPRLKKEQQLYKEIIQSRKGIMTRKTYIKIVACLHSDWVTDVKQKARYDEAFRLFTELEKILLNERDSETHFVHIPFYTPAEVNQTVEQYDEKTKKTK